MTNIVAADRITLTAVEIAGILGISKLTWYRLYQSGKTPKPARLGRRLFWNRAEIFEWHKAGMPSEVVWEASKRGGTNE